MGAGKENSVFQELKGAWAAGAEGGSRREE